MSQCVLIMMATTPTVLLQVSALVVGEVIRAPMFVATSFNRHTAQKFAKNAGYILVVTIPANCKNACRVHEHSEFEYEEEVLIPPYSPFRILTIDHAWRTIKLELLDGGVHADHELSSGIHALAKPL